MVSVAAGSSLDLSGRDQKFAGLSGGRLGFQCHYQWHEPRPQVAANQTYTFSGTIGSTFPTSAFIKSGLGTQILSGTNTYTGATTINTGTLQLGFGTVSSNILPSASALVLGGGTLTLSGIGTQTMNGLTTSASTSSRIVSGANETLTLGALTSAGAGSSLNFNTSAGGANASTSNVGTGIVVLTGQASGAPINPGFTVLDAGGFGLATVNASNRVIRLTTGALLPASGANSTTAYTVNNNPGGSSAAGSSSLNLTASAAAASITVDTTPASGVLTLNSGVLLRNNIWNFGGVGSNTYLITGSAGGAGLTSVAAGDGLTLNIYNNAAVTIASPILANGNNAVLVNGAGTGAIILAGENTYSGGTTITTGTLQLGVGGASGSITGNVTNNGNIVFNRSDDFTFAGVISGSGGVANNGNILRFSAAQTYAGPTQINTGILVLPTTVDFGLSASSVVTVAGASFLDLSGRNQKFAGLSGGGSVYSFNSSGTSLTLQVAPSQSYTFSGVIGGTYPDFSLIKSDLGTQILSGTNTYTGHDHDQCRHAADREQWNNRLASRGQRDH